MSLTMKEACLKMFEVSLLYILEQSAFVCRVYVAFTVDVGQEIFERLIQFDNNENDIHNIHKIKFSYSSYEKRTFKT